MTTTHTTTHPEASLDLERLAVDLERHDQRVTARHADVVAEQAREQGLDSPSLDVLTDPTASTVARERALAVVAARLARRGAAERGDVLATVA